MAVASCSRHAGWSILSLMAVFTGTSAKQNQPLPLMPFSLLVCVSLQSKMVPLQACMKEAGDCRTRDDFENHTKAIGEAMGASAFFSP